MSGLSAVVAAFAVVSAVPADAAQRAFVASYGSDSNVAVGCGAANPCRSFATAVTVVDPNGEVLALDSIGYGTVTLTQSITLVAAPGAYAGISVSSGNGVTIATGGISVTLRGLTINHIGGSGNGVSMTNGASVSIENCVISGFSSGSGVSIDTAATARIIDSVIRDNFNGIYLGSGATAAISGSKIVGNSNDGVYASGLTAGTTTTATIVDSLVAGNGLTGVYAYAPDATATARASVTRSNVSGNYHGILADAGSGIQVITVGSSLVAGNAGFGLCANTPGGGTTTLNSLGNNTVRQNLTNSFSITPLSPL